MAGKQSSKVKGSELRQHPRLTLRGGVWLVTGTGENEPLGLTTDSSCDGAAFFCKAPLGLRVGEPMTIMLAAPLADGNPDSVCLTIREATIVRKEGDDKSPKVAVQFREPHGLRPDLLMCKMARQRFHDRADKLAN